MLDLQTKRDEGFNLVLRCGAPPFAHAVHAVSLQAWCRTVEYASSTTVHVIPSLQPLDSAGYTSSVAVPVICQGAAQLVHPEQYTASAMVHKTAVHAICRVRPGQPTLSQYAPSAGNVVGSMP